ncbi:hypothetical protein Tco_0248774, partial [Tanacetum coccineum]
ISTVKSEVPNAVKDYLGTTLDDTLYKPQQSKEKTAEEIQKIKLEQAGKQQDPKFTITSSDSIALNEFDQKMSLFEEMTNSKSCIRSPKQRALYRALMEAITENEMLWIKVLLIR